MDTEFIRTTLTRLRQFPASQHLFGVRGHSFILHPTLSEADVAAFESRHSIVLPAEYRRYLCEVGNGGVGPGYGLLPLGTRMVERHPTAFDAHVEGGWSPSQPFQHRYAWNRTPPQQRDPETEHCLEFECWQEEYLDPRWMNGALPLSSLGCGLTDWLVVTGREAGKVWGDYRADGSGIAPLGLSGKRRLTFGEWYLSWLLYVVAVAEGQESLPALPQSVPHNVPTLFDGFE